MNRAGKRYKTNAAWFRPPSNLSLCAWKNLSVWVHEQVQKRFVALADATFRVETVSVTGQGEPLFIRYVTLWALAANGGGAGNKKKKKRKKEDRFFRPIPSGKTIEGQ